MKKIEIITPEAIYDFIRNHPMKQIASLEIIEAYVQQRLNSKYFIGLDSPILPTFKHRVKKYAEASSRFMYYDNYAKGWEDCIDVMIKINEI